MAYEWFTLAQAAKHLGVSSRTLRRWIHAGKLQAELRPGPYGQQYVVPGEQLGAVQLVRDVERVEREHEQGPITQLVEEDHLQQREQALIDAIEALRAEIQRATEQTTAGQAAILSELQELRRVLEASRSRDDAAGG